MELPAPATVTDGAGSPLPHEPDTLVVIGELPTAEHRRAALDWAAHHGAPVIAEPGPGTHHLVLPHGDLLLTATDWVGEHLPRRLLVVGRPTLGRSVPALTRAPGLRVEVVTSGEPGADGWADAAHAASAVHPFAALRLTGEEGGGDPPSPGPGWRPASGSPPPSRLRPVGPRPLAPCTRRCCRAPRSSSAARASPATSPTGSPTHGPMSRSSPAGGSQASTAASRRRSGSPSPAPRRRSRCSGT
ncbi:2-succinyl-6-hydroxy-2,4-cyclohexadiene-1- carboxylic acid synthase/2-oxoglutarate decarboxylase [Janibacter hoylei PVAS-1]|uniref:2-succinyl-6-hydroxy-2,4-cyclohexadiene-1-carboxylic acid synthase/2-oxoglutarate decarboxylase n=1 Tax=Janibacter hoylei PVAS-1 TaxID=1210046 RepID=K1E4H4_9MICO|nr:2-succinyl-6-hydroxy-2,4-cyclohexadiene-1- carboxylic acid synthase/2-oxoglutarate decarboxylase [Janibacter hoylei PVAS-1]